MTTGRRTPLFVFLALLTLGSAAPEVRAQPAGATRLVVVDRSQAELPAPFSQVDLAAEVGREVKNEGCEVVRACRLQDCPPPDSAEASARVLSFDARYDRGEFSCAVSVEIEDPVTGRLEYREKSSSPICPAAELLANTRRAARLACAHVRSLAQNRKPDRSPPPATQLVTLAPEAGTPWLGTGLVVAGATSLAAGAVLLYLHGRPTDCVTDPSGVKDCARKTNTSTGLAIPLVLVGAGGLGWGIWDLSNRPAEPPGNLVVGWSIRGLFVGGSY